jgi:transposase
VSPGKIRELSEKIEELGREISELKRRLSLYENSNSPPSKNSLVYREMRRVRRRRRSEEEKGGGPALKKPGRKEGHEGVTQVFEPTEYIVHTMERCPRCDSTDLYVISTERRTVVDLPEPLPYTVMEHVINVYGCSGCGAEKLLPESATRALPSSSAATMAEEKMRGDGITLGRNLLSTISLLWSVARLPQRKISYLLGSLHGLELSPATVGHALENVSESLEAFQERVRKGINRSGAANFDESGMPVAGRRGWIWVAATARYAFVQVAMSRGRGVLERYFPGFKGVAIVDGWKPYRSFFSLIQRCWAHVLREAEVLSLRASDKEEAEALLSSLRGIFQETRSGLEEHPPPNRKLHYRMLRKLRALLSREYTDADVHKFVSKLKAASSDLFTFTMHRGVEPTNNHAERELREPIVHRKIRGQLKCEKGIAIFSRLMTAVSTWKLQGLNPFVEFKRYV